MSIKIIEVFHFDLAKHWPLTSSQYIWISHSFLQFRICIHTCCILTLSIELWNYIIGICNAGLDKVSHFASVMLDFRTCHSKFLLDSVFPQSTDLYSTGKYIFPYQATRKWIRTLVTNIFSPLSLASLANNDNAGNKGWILFGCFWIRGHCVINHF